MIKRLTIIASIAASVLVALFGFATPASAHVLKTDGSIGIVIHIDPEDDPIAGSPATFFFELKDKDNKFDPANCTCTVAILKGGAILISEPLFSASGANNINSPTFQYTFPERAVYTLSITGAPKTPGGFQNFNITYDIRVSRQANGTAAPAPTTTQSHTAHYVLFGAAFIAIAIVFIHDKFKSKKSIKEKQ